MRVKNGVALIALGAAAGILSGCVNLTADKSLLYSPATMPGANAQFDAMTMARNHYGKGQYGLAITYYHAALRNDGESLQAKNGLAASYDRLGRFDLADRYYQEALAQDPNNPDTLNNLGFSHMLRGNYEEARRNLKLAEAAASDDPAAAATVGANLLLVAEVLDTRAERKQAAQVEPFQVAAIDQPAARGRSESGAAGEGDSKSVRLVRVSRHVQELITRPETLRAMDAVAPVVPSQIATAGPTLPEPVQRLIADQAEQVAVPVMPAVPMGSVTTDGVAELKPVGAPVDLLDNIDQPTVQRGELLRSALDSYLIDKSVPSREERIAATYGIESPSVLSATMRRGPLTASVETRVPLRELLRGVTTTKRDIEVLLRADGLVMRGRLVADMRSRPNV